MELAQVVLFVSWKENVVQARVIVPSKEIVATVENAHSSNTSGMRSKIWEIQLKHTKKRKTHATKIMTDTRMKYFRQCKCCSHVFYFEDTVQCKDHDCDGLACPMCEYCSLVCCDLKLLKEQNKFLTKLLDKVNSMIEICNQVESTTEKEENARNKNNDWHNYNESFTIQIKVTMWCNRMYIR